MSSSGPEDAGIFARGAEPSGHRPTWAEIDLDALAANFRVVREHVGPDVSVLAAVKANAYGHGAVPCARRLEAEGVHWFGVALPEEGVELREAGIERPVLCLGGLWRGQEETCLLFRLVPVVYRLDVAEAFDRAARA
ncbi:MAG TPA: alanine racemase, partial [Pyrinomonadaceae bacterium]